MRRLCTASLVLLCCSLAGAQNLLINPSFTDPPIETPCSEDWQDVTAWEMTVQSSPAGTGDRRNGDFKAPPCPRDGDDTHVSLQGWGSETKMVWQTVDGLTAGNHYKLSGVWFYGADFLAFGGLNVFAELRSGSSPTGGTVLGSTSATIVNATTSMWLPFQTCGQLTSGTQITVVLRATYGGLVGYAFHADDLVLEQVSSCVEPNRVDSVTPGYGVRGDLVNVTLTGLDFTRGPISAKLSRPGAVDIPATNIQVTSPTVMTCRFNLAGAPNGRWNVSVTYGSGSPTTATLPNGFMVVVPALSNGSFEAPTVPGGCPATPLSGHPTDWLVSHTGSWGDSGYADSTVVRDRSDVVPPTCPPPDGAHYASTYSVPPAPGAQPESWAYQTIVADPTKTYTVSGYFAGAGKNTVTLELLDGTEQDGTVPDMDGGLIHDGGPAYDWTFGYARGTPTGNLMTVRWRVSTRYAGPHVAHADALRIDVCAANVSLTAVSPALGDNTGTINNVEVLGSGFGGEVPPQVILRRPGTTSVNARNVVVHSDSRLTCSFDLSGQLTGVRDVIVVKLGCVAVLPDAFVVLGPELVNGSFELPDPGVPVDCVSPDNVLRGGVEGWSVRLDVPGSLDRDHHVMRPETCPSPAGGHYGSLTIDRAGELLAYQTLRVQPTAGYTLSGVFAGGGVNAAEILLIDGTLETGSDLARVDINSEVLGNNYDWRARSVSAYARSEVLTVVWRVNCDTGPAHALHADGLVLAMTSPPCGRPFGDADGDGDVDQADFAALQRCYTYAGATAAPEACRCFDRNGDGEIDMADFVQFAQCAGGPNVPADPACGD